MQTQKDLAITLRSIPFEERHRIVTALTENHGLISAMAKNSIQSRRFGGSLEPFAASEWIFSQRPGAELYSLTESSIRNPFEGLREDFQKLSLASALNELMLKLAPQNEACKELFQLHSNALFALNTIQNIQPIDSVRFLNAYLAKVLQWNGSQPRLTGCLQCGIPLNQMSSDQEVSCMVADAGWICPTCRQQETRHVREREGGNFQHSLLRLKVTALFDFQTSLSTSIRNILSHSHALLYDHQQLFKFLEALFVFHIPGFDKSPIKSLRFIGLESSVLPAKANLR